MGVGLSDGTSYADNREWMAETLSAKTVSDRQEMAGNEASGDFQSRFLAANVPDTSGIPPEALRKAGDALNSTGLIQVPENVPQENFKAAVKDLGLNTQEQDLYKRHLVNLYSAGGVDNPPSEDAPLGSRSTLYQTTLEHDGKHYAVPTVWDGQKLVNTDANGKFAGISDAGIKNVEKFGWDNFPSYATPEQAEARYQKMHDYMDRDTGRYFQQKNLPNIEDVPHHDWVEGMAKAAWKGVTLPGDVMAGKVDPLSQEGIERSFDLAATMIFGPGPIVAKTVDGTLGSMAGVKAIDNMAPRSAPSPLKTKLYQAQNMELDAAHPDEIHEATGFFRGADNRWRFEIPDQNAKLKLENLDHRPATSDVTTPDKIIIGGQESVRIPDKEIPEFKNVKDVFDWFAKPMDKKENLRLGDILHHPDLYKAYPELAYKPVRPMPKAMADKNIGGMASEDALYVAPSNPDQFKSVILHEVQHYIQDAEGFARGGNQYMFTPQKLPAAQNFFEKVRKQTESEIAQTTDLPVTRLKNWVRFEKESPNLPTIKTKSEAHQDYEKWKDSNPEDFKRLRTIVDAEDLLQAQSEKQYEQYQRLMGEVEARNVQRRMNYGQTERDLIPPYRTESRPRDLQINNKS